MTSTESLMYSHCNTQVPFSSISEKQPTVHRADLLDQMIKEMLRTWDREQPGREDPGNPGRQRLHDLDGLADEEAFDRVDDDLADLVLPA